MLATNDHFDRAGGAQYPAVTPKEGGGFIKTLIKSDAPFGSIVMAGVDDSEALLDSGVGVGERSPMQVVELPSDPATYGLCGLFGVTQTEGTHLQDTKGPVVVGNKQVQARVVIPATGIMPALLPLMPDFTTTPGTLIPWDGSAKCVALLSASFSDVTLASTERLLYVWFNGTHGFSG